MTLFLFSLFFSCCSKKKSHKQKRKRNKTNKSKYNHYHAHIRFAFCIRLYKQQHIHTHIYAYLPSERIDTVISSHVVMEFWIFPCGREGKWIGQNSSLLLCVHYTFWCLNKLNAIAINCGKINKKKTFLNEN